MHIELKNIYSELTSGRLTKAEAMERIRALKGDENTSASTAKTTRLVTPQWIEQALVENNAEYQRVEVIQSVDLLDEPLSIDDKDIAVKFNRAALNLFAKVKAFVSQKNAGTGLMQFVVAPNQSLLKALQGLLRTACLENPSISAQTIMLDAPISADKLKSLLSREAKSGFSGLIGYVAGTRQVMAWQDVQSANHQIQSANHQVQTGLISFKQNGCYLITGGLGGIGLEFAKSILASGNATKVVLTGRAKQLSTEQQQKLDAIQQDGRVSYLPMDLADVKSVKSVIDGLAELNGVLHSAGMNQDSYIVQKTEQQFSQVLSPKVAGSVHLQQALAGKDVDFLALFSSVSSWLGNLGQADYSCANGFMEAFALLVNEQNDANHNVHLVSINWPLWLAGGMNIQADALAALEQRTGLSAIESSTGIGAFHHSLLLGLSNTMLLEGDAQVLRTITLPEKAYPEKAYPEKALSEKAPVPVKPSEKAQQKQTVSGDTKHNISDNISEKIETLILAWLKQQFSALLHLPVERIDANAQMENYGMDSILAMNLTTNLEKTLGPLPKTLFFEYLTIGDLAGFLKENHADTLNQLLAQSASGSKPLPAQDIELSANEAISPLSHFSNSSRSNRRSSRRSSRISQARPVATKTASHHSSHKQLNQDIAIVGLSGRYPQSNDLNAYWQNLAGGVDCISEVPTSRWDWQTWFSEDRSEPNKHYSKWGGFIEGVEEFDPRFFNIAPKEASTIDPQERIFLQHVWHAIEDAGLTKQSLQIERDDDLSGQVGVYAGVMYGEYSRSGSLASVANRASYVLNVHGPSMTIDTMCSSSLTAIHLACQDLKTGRTDVGIAGGVNVSVHPGKYLMLSSGQFISSDGHCQSFGIGGDGYIPGEGVGVMVLRRLNDAQQQGHSIYGVIKGTSLNHGGKTNGYTVPNPNAQAAVVKQAIQEANIDPRQINYIEAHGTGTKLGDPIEIAALTKAFYKGVEKHQQQAGFCLIGSAKSNVGHCESAAGIAGVTKVLLQMRHQQIAPSLHSNELNPHIDFSTTPFVVNQQLTDWQPAVIDGKEAPRTAGISSFGAGGANAHIVLQEYVLQEYVLQEYVLQEYVLPEKQKDDNQPVAIILSARTQGQLQQKAQDLVAFLNQQNVSLQNLAYTLQLGREPMDQRIGFVAHTLDEVKKQLTQFSALTVSSIKRLTSIATSPEINGSQSATQSALISIIDSWLNGAKVDWHRLYDNAHNSAADIRLISLPGYPFAKDKYWHMPEVAPIVKAHSDDESNDEGNNEDKDRAQAQAPQIVAQTLHPLVHSNVSDLSGLRYRSHFAATDKRLVNGQLPDLMLLEMATVVAHLVAANNASIDNNLVLNGLTYGAQGVAGDIEMVVLADGRLEIFQADNVLLQAQVHNGIQASSQTGLQKAANVATQQLTATDVYSALDECLTQNLGQYRLLQLEALTITANDGDSIFVEVANQTGSHVSSESDSKDISLYNSQGQLLLNASAVSYDSGVLSVSESKTPEITAPKITAPKTLTPKASAPNITAPETQPIEAAIPTEIALPNVVITVDADADANAGNILSEETLNKPTNIQISKPQAFVADDNLALAKPKIAMPIAQAFTSGAIASTTTGIAANITLIDQGNGVVSMTSAASQSTSQSASQGTSQSTSQSTSEVKSSVKSLLAGLDKINSLAASSTHIKVVHIELGGKLSIGQTRAELNQAISAGLFKSLSLCQLPVIFSLNSDCLGADALLASCGDFIVSAPDTQFSFNGIVPSPLEKALLNERFGNGIGSALVNQWLFSQAKSTAKDLAQQHWMLNVDANPAKACEQLIASLIDKSQHALTELKPHLNRFIIRLVDKLEAFEPEPEPELKEANNQSSQSELSIAGLKQLAYQGDELGVLKLTVKDKAAITVAGISKDFGLINAALASETSLATDIHCIEFSLFADDTSQANSKLQKLTPKTSDVAKYLTLFNDCLVPVSVEFGHTVCGFELFLSLVASVSSQQKFVLPTIDGLSLNALSASSSQAIVLNTQVVKASISSTGVVEISLQESEAKNMFSEPLAKGLREAFDNIATRDDAKVVVLTGYDSYFASGGTLDTLLAIQNGTAQFTDEKTFQLPLDCPLPVIAAMQGHGLGGGWSFGLFADAYLYAQQSHFVSPYMNYGFTPGAGSTLVFPKRLGYDLARLSLLTGVQLTGDELKAKAAGLTVLAREQVLACAHQMAEQLAVLPQQVLVEIKQAAIAHLKLELESTYAKELTMHDKTFVGSSDTLNQINDKFIKQQGEQSGEDEQNDEAASVGSDVAAATIAQASIAAASIAAASIVVSSETIQENLRNLLAAELHIDNDDIEDHEQFVDLGLDSITGVTFVRKINAEYGTDLEATKIYSYSTLVELTDHIQSLVQANAPAAQATATEAPAAQALAPEKAPEKTSLDSIQNTLRSVLASELHIDEDELENNEQFVDLGLDSITGVTFIRKVNSEFNTDIEATKVYSYPTIAELADFVQSITASEVVEIAKPELAASQAAVAPQPTLVNQTTQFNPRPTLSSWRVEAANLVNAPAASANTTNRSREPIAVIGMAGQFPMANDIDSFWDNIAAGKNCISEIDNDRWSTGRYFQAGSPKPGKTNSKWLGTLEQYDLFDPLFFNISPGEAETMDPQQRLFLQACYHGIEHAAINPVDLSGARCGVFVGCSTGDYHQVNRPVQLSAQGFTGSASSILAARISYFLNLQGPSIAIETACSSSLVAIANACDSLNNDSSDIALAGGSCVMSGPDMHIMTSQAGMLSTDGRCFTFDQRANGFVPGEAVGVVLLKRLADAEQDDDIVHGVIRGWGINQDGKTNGITAPSEVSQTRLMEQVYRKFDIDPADIQLIEAHGTGTKLGDPIEVAGLKAAFKPFTDQQDYCALGSAKSNIGHCLTAAGVSGVIKLVQALKHQMLPPTINFEQQNEHISLDNSPFYINTRLQPWQVTNGGLRQGAVSSFGFSGTNAHVVISEYQNQASQSAANNITVKSASGGLLIPLSAKTELQLEQKMQQLLDFIEQHPHIELTTLAYTLQIGREAMDIRAGFISKDVAQFKTQLAAQLTAQLAAQLAASNNENKSPSKSPNKNSSKSLGTVYRAAVKDHKESMKLIAQDADMRELLVERYLQDNKLSKILKLWTQGLQLDWQLLYGDAKPSRMVLPVYPFAKEQYWLEAAQSAEQVEGQIAQNIHPLLHHNVSLLSQQRYHSQFTLEDSVINNDCLPVSALVEMICAAALDATQDVEPSGALTIRNLVLAAPIEIDAQFGTDLYLDLSAGIDAANNSTIEFTVIGAASSGASTGASAGADNSIDAEIIHAQGQVDLVGQPLNQWDMAALSDSLVELGRADSSSQLWPVGLLERALPAKAQCDSIGAITVNTQVANTLGRDNLFAHVRDNDAVSDSGVDIDILDHNGMGIARIEGLHISEVASAARDTAAFTMMMPKWEVIQPAADSANSSVSSSANSSVSSSANSSVSSSSNAKGIVAIGCNNEYGETLKAVYPNDDIQILEFSADTDVQSIQNSLAGLSFSQVIFVANSENSANLKTMGEQSILDEQQVGVMLLFRLIKAMLGLGLDKQVIDWSIISFNSVQVRFDDMVNPTHAGLHGFSGAMAKEFRHWQVRLLDVDSLTPALLTQAHSFTPTQDGDCYSSRHGQWFAQQLVEIEHLEQQQPPYRKQGVYVMIGGSGGIGEVFSEKLIKEHNAQIVWIGRRPQDADIEAKLARLGQFGQTPSYVQADVTDFTQLQDAYQSIKAQHPQIHGILHSAVGAFDKSLQAVSEAEFSSILAVKTQGAVYLGQLFADEPLDFVLGFSSNAAFARQGGMAGYSAGCTFKDTYLQQLGKALGCVGKVMNWGYWSIGAGDTVSDSFKGRFYESGHRPIEVDEGMGALDKLLTSSVNQMSVAKMLPGVKGEMASTERFVCQYPETISHQADFSVSEQQTLPVNFDSLDGKVGAEMEGLLPGLLNAILTENQNTLPFYARWRIESNEIAQRAGLTPDGSEQSAQAMWDKWDAAKVSWMKDASKKALCQLVETCLRALPDILNGKVKATDVVFPNSSLTLVEAVYKTDTVSLAFNECLSDTVVNAVKQRLALDPESKIRILEIGAGTGSSTVGIIRKLKPIQDSIAEYCYTDLSKAFLFHAEQHYAPDAPYLVTKIFNVEQPIEGQGIDPNKYDFVVAANVLHATKNIRNTMRNTKAVMKVGGAVLLNEISDKSIYGHLTFGLLEGWWLNEDDELRIPGSPGLYPKQWQEILNDEGYQPVYYPAQSVHQLGQQIVMAVSDGFVNQKFTDEQKAQAKTAQMVKAQPAKIAKPEKIAKPVVRPIVNQPAQPIQIAQPVQPEQSAPSGVDLTAKAVDLIKQVIAGVLKMSVNQLDANEPLESYGIDSIIIGQVNELLKADFDDIDATVLYEHQTISALAGHLTDNYQPQLEKMYGAAQAPVVQVQAPAPVAQVKAPVPAVQAQAPDTSNLPDKTRQYLKQVIAGALKMSQNQIDAQEPLESYGIDSIIIGQINESLKSQFVDIDATVLYECQNIAQMADYLQDKYFDVLVDMFGEAVASETVASLAVAQPAAQAISASAPQTASQVQPARGAIKGRAMLISGTAQVTQQLAVNSGPIAIIGVSGIYPQAANLDEYWQNLQAGKDCVIEVPANRWDVEAFYDPDEQKAIDQGKSYSKWGGFISQFAQFDAFFFGISPREAMDMDPQERLFLQESWRALEDAGVTKENLKQQYQGEVGVFVGITRPGYSLYGSSEAIRKERFRPRSSFSSVANRLSYLLDIHGPSMPIDTMCSSSLTAIHQACTHLERGDCQLAITGGVNIYVHPLSYVDMASQHMFSKDGRCKSFGEGGNGFVPGEGVGAIILKPLNQAQADNDHIHGLILSTHINHGGKTNGFSVPNPKAQGDLIRRTIDKAGISARAISYIEAHGTGTELGDPIEISGLQQAFGPDSTDKGYCAIGSAKSNIGHCEGAAGIASFTKVLLQLKNQQIVPSLHADVLNPHIQFSKTAFVLNRELNHWQAPVIDGAEQPRIAGVSSFGAGGGNAHVLMQEYIMPTNAPVGSNSVLSEPVAIVLSAKNKEQLQQKVSDLVDFIADKGNDINLEQMAYTLQLGREAMDERLAILANSLDALTDKLRGYLYQEPATGDLFSGVVQKNDAQLTLMREDDDLKAAIDNWLVRRKLPKLLELWVKGLNVDWSIIYGQQKVGMMPLPTYPFAKDCYWIDSLDLTSDSQAQVQLSQGMDAIEDILDSIEGGSLDTEQAVNLIKSR